MNLLITGSSSYLGKNLIQFLKKKNIKYIGIDTVKSRDKNTLKIDINDKNLLIKLKKYKIDTIIHLAAISNSQRCAADELGCFKTNVLGTINMLNFAKKKKIKKFIFASTEWIYEIQKQQKIKNKMTGKIDKYALSKKICEDIIKLNNLDFVILRLGIIYGKRSPTNFSAVESIVYQNQKSKFIKVNSKKTARRYIHINDIIKSIYESLIFKRYLNKIVDIQGPKLISFKEIVKKLKFISNKNPRLIETAPKKFSIRNIKSNYSKIFRPKVDIEKGLKLVISEINEKSY